MAGLIAAIAMVFAADSVSAQNCANCGTSAGGTSLVGNHHAARLNTVPNYGGPPAQLYQYGNPDLYSNWYVGPAGVPFSGSSNYGAALYMAPYPIPPHVGSTFYTYEPFMPHEMLYRHNKTYHNYYNGGRGMTRASVTWR